MLAKILPNNEHIIERIARVVLGVGLLALTVTGPQTLWGLLGVVPLLTGVLGSCPIYTVLGFSTASGAGKARHA